jgi:signal peptidase
VLHDRAKRFDMEPQNRHFNMSVNMFVGFWAKAGVGLEYSLLVTGHSMRPFLYHNRSVVFIVKKQHYEHRKGDIVLFQRDTGDIVLHRILCVSTKGTLLVNGDAQNWTETIRPAQVCAQVTRIRRKTRTVSVRNPVYRLCVAVWIRLFPVRPFLFWLRARLPKRKNGVCG